MKHLHLDFETRSTVDIKSAGLDRYSRNAEVLMLAWAIDNAPVRLWQPVLGEDMPSQLHYCLKRDDVKKVAWHAQFERAIFLHCLKMDIPVEQWLDPKVMARYASAPASLEQAGEIFGLPEHLAKDKDGKRLIQKFCKPRKNGEFVQPSDAPEDWKKFGDYCVRDVVAERELLHLLEPFTLPDTEEKLRRLDAKINETGLPVDVEFVERNKAAVLSEKQQLFLTMQEITKLDNPNSVSQLLGWLQTQGYPYKSLGAKRIEQCLEGR